MAVTATKDSGFQIGMVRWQWVCLG